MKKLLSILAAVTLTATASSSVVACGKSSSSTASADDLTKTILKNSSMDIESEDLLKDIYNKDPELVFGTHADALKTFLNYAAEAFMKNSDDLQKISSKYIADGIKSSDATVKAKAMAAASYVDDDLWDSIKQDWTTKQSNANDAWDQAVKDAKAKYGKKWTSSWLADLKKQFGELVYKNGNKVKATSTDDYKDLYISYTILNGSTNGKSLADSLKDDIYLWGTAPVGNDVVTAKNNIMSQVFKANNLTIGGKTINFGTNNKTTQDLTKRDGTWLSQMDNFIEGLQASLKTAKNDPTKMSPDDQTLLDDLIAMINVSGGYDLEIQLGDTPNKTNYMIGDSKWASRENIFTTITDANVKDWSNELIERWDYNYENDFGTKAPATAATTDLADLILNSAYDVSQQVGTVYSSVAKATSNQINGLFSNAQRFVANDYYQVERPVAVSELVVKPLYSDGPDLDQLITNKKYVGTDANGQTGLMDSFYRFIGNFIDNSVDTATKGAKTNSVTDGTSNFSWDDLMTQGVSNINDITTGAPFDSKFTGDVSFTSHSNLLTLDSSSSDYSDLLKYSVYDYLNGNGKAIDWKDANNSPENIALSSVLESKSDAAKEGITNGYNTVTGLVNSLNRATKNNAAAPYKVVNAKQGIIAFIDKDGIHFVRIEGYGLLDKNGTGKPAGTESLATNQSQLTVNDFATANSSDKARNAFHTAQLLSSDLSSSNDQVKKFATDITSDYLTTNSSTPTTAQMYSGLRYSDLNNNFGNSYLRFLANSSIAKSNGVSSAKYSYDLNSELKSYAGADLTDDNLADSSKMLKMIWDYVSTITGMDDSQLFDWVANNSQTVATNQSLLFDVLRNSNAADNVKVDFEELYKKYIKTAISFNSLNNRVTKAGQNFSIAFGTADEKLETGTKWNNPGSPLDGWHPTVNFKTTAKDTTTDSSWYDKQADNVQTNKIWVPYSGTTDVTTPLDKDKQSFYYATSRQHEYDVQMSEFIPNDFALKGDEE